MHTRLATLGVLLLVVAIAPQSARADCVDGGRTSTAEEQAFSRRLGESLKATIPAAPAPLCFEREPEVITASLCGDTPQAIEDTAKEAASSALRSLFGR